MARSRGSQEFPGSSGAAPPSGPGADQPGAGRPLEVMLSGFAAFMMALMCLVVGLLVLVVVWAIIRLGLVGWDRSWLSPTIVFSLVGLACLVIGLALVAGGRGLLRRQAAARRRLFVLFGLGVVAVAPTTAIILGTYLGGGGGSEFVLAGLTAIVVTVVGILGLLTKGTKAWFGL